LLFNVSNLVNFCIYTRWQAPPPESATLLAADFSLSNPSFYLHTSFTGAFFPATLRRMVLRGLAATGRAFRMSRTAIRVLGAPVPMLGTCVPALGTCVPELGTCVPALGTCVPALGTPVQTARIAAHRAGSGHETEQSGQTSAGNGVFCLFF
jgi:hypothetical protein